jgi:glyoxylase-like metal-dependent hydrolase (beta-lactamase superfamily II)
MCGWAIDQFKVDRVVEFQAAMFPPAALLPAATPGAIESHRHWLEPHLMDPESKLLVVSFHSYVVRTPRHTILVDTGAGNLKSRPDKLRFHMKEYPYLERLAAVGVSPEAVDLVLCTHLHVDHVGWNTRLQNGQWVPTFPRAKYLFGRKEWEHWQEVAKRPGNRVEGHHEDSVLPVIEAGQAVFVEADHEIEDGMWLEPSPGHTPGHVSVHLSGGGREAVIVGDMMNHALQVAEPDWSTCFCSDPGLASRTRRAFLERYAGTDTLVMPGHFPTPTAGRIVRSGATFRFVFDAGN